MDNGWIIIIIVIACLVILYFLSGFICAFICISKSKKVDKELLPLIEYEKQRGKLIIDDIKLLVSKGFKFDQADLEKLVTYNDCLSELDIYQRAEYKNMIEFCALLVAKIYDENKNLGQYLNAENVENYRSYQKNGDLKYKQYNKRATRYNALLYMPFTKTALRIMGKSSSPKPIL